MDKKEPKKITLGLVLSWILGVFFAIGGLAMLFTSFLSGLLVLLIAIILLPPTKTFIEKKFNFTLSKGLRIVLIIVLLVVASSLRSQDEDADLDTAVDDLNESVDDLKEAVGVEEEEEEITYTEVDLDSFFEEYDSNEVSAEEKYVGKYIQTSGIITDIAEDILGKKYISLEPISAGEWYVGPTLQCYVRNGESLSDLSKGDTITVQTRIADSTITSFSITAKDCIVKE